MRETGKCEDTLFSQEAVGRLSYESANNHRIFVIKNFLSSNIHWRPGSYFRCKNSIMSLFAQLFAGFNCNWTAVYTFFLLRLKRNLDKYVITEKQRDPPVLGLLEKVVRKSPELWSSCKLAESCCLVDVCSIKMSFILARSINRSNTILQLK